MMHRLQITVLGAVQGVGFRPFVYRLAKQMGLNGYVFNSSIGVMIEVEGSKPKLDQFILKLEKDKPVNAVIHSMEFSYLDPIGFSDFTIQNSRDGEELTTIILPDIAVCADCLRELYDPKDRRYLYPFINCTNCGPRFSIIESLPYDRPNTSMKIFKMCSKCKSEYEEPKNRRFHAQPIACPDCGPHVELWDSTGDKLRIDHNALLEAARHIQDGKVVAMKGLGGFHLIVDAGNDHAVEVLRHRKNREEKPFAVMFPSLKHIKRVCLVSEFEERLLRSPESPIVLVKKREIHANESSFLSNKVAPNNPYFGVMLPYTPLHHLLLKKLDFPIVATSGNLSEEPIVIDECEALERLSGIVDYFLVHNRPIVRHVDDSILRVIMGRELVLRRARGYAPLPVQANTIRDKNQTIDQPILAVGPYLKNTIAIGDGRNITISQHIGDLSTEESMNAFEKVIIDFTKMFRIKKLEVVVADLHPEYLSTKYAEEHFKDIFYVQHHQAHIAACRAENRISERALGVAWDGTGYGLDHSVWGGEFFISDKHQMEHVGQFRKFPLPGGDLAIIEPRRAAIGILFEIFGSKVFDSSNFWMDFFSEAEKSVIQQMLVKNINCPISSSAGRLFDVVSSLLKICQKMSYEGQAAMMVEFLADRKEKGKYQFEMSEKPSVIIDWQPIIEQILEDIDKSVNPRKISMKFHNTLAETILSMAKHFKLEKVLLSGGCFQNAILLETTVKLLEQSGFRVYWHQRVPPNDGGIALGQIALANAHSGNSNMIYPKTQFKKVFLDN